MSLRLFHSLNKSAASGGGLITSPAAANPTALSWTKLADYRYLTQIDENHIHYTSNFSAGTSTLTAVTGSAPVVSGGNLQVSGSCLYKSTSNPIASWMTAEMTIASMGSAGASQKLGPAIVKDASNYLACVYDSVAQRVQIIKNGTVVRDFARTLNPVGLKIWIVVHRYYVNMWTKEASGAIAFQAHFESTDEYVGNNIALDFKYGVYCSQGAATTHQVSSVRGGASGGVGIFNNRVAANEDGSPYIHEGKLLMTGDLSAQGDQNYTYNAPNSCVFSVDLNDYSLTILTRFYFRRNSKILGGQNIKLYRMNTGNWIMTYTPVDDSGSLEGPDVYIDDLTDSEVLTNGETIINASRLKSFNIAITNIFDVNVRKVDGLWYSLWGRGFGAARPALFVGTQIDNMVLTEEYDDGNFQELTCWARMNNTWYYIYMGFDYLKPRVYNHPSLTLLGTIDTPVTSNNGRIPGSDWFVKQVGGTVEYYLIVFDNQELTTIDAGGNSVRWQWSLGMFEVWKANETAVGTEF
jgi:hypothetical protein